jgi:hypothetical protein
MGIATAAAALPVTSALSSAFAADSSSSASGTSTRDTLVFDKDDYTVETTTVTTEDGDKAVP